MRDSGGLDDPGARMPPRDLVGGAPRWLSEQLVHCSRCGSPLELGPLPGEHRQRHHCRRCGLVAYLNPRLVVSTLPVTDAGEVVLLRRAIDPGRGAWAQPGGFLEADETAIQGAIRETREETGLIVTPTRIVGLYSRPQAAVVVVAYEAEIVGGVMHATDEALEVRAFDPDAIPWRELAFNTTIWALRDWMASIRPGSDTASLGLEHPER
jgi:ADP-ribose pyrophosphatase YjhB (NUDIX family)